MYNSRNLVNNIKSIAKDRNILIRDMLTACELNINTLSQMSDKKGLSSFALAKIADYLDCSVDYLLGRSDTPWLAADRNAALPDCHRKSAPSPRDEALLDSFRQLNEEGQEKVLDYTDDLVQSGKYIKSDPPQLGQKA